MSYPSKSVRERCWNAKDKYWECLELNNEEPKACLKWREEFEKNCSAVWVKHFDRKRKYEKFREEMDKSNWSMPSEKEQSSN